MNENIERSLLATFLWSNDFGMDTDEAFELDTSIFSSDDRKLIAAKINETTATEDRFYSLLNLEIQNTSHYEWLAISEQTPMPFSVSKRYQNKLIDRVAMSYADRI